MRPLLHAFIFAAGILLTAGAATAQTTAPPPKTLKEALNEWSWTWTGPNSNTVVTFEPVGRLVTLERQVSHWELVNGNLVRVSANGMRPIILAFNQDFSGFVQAGGGAAPIAGRRHRMVVYRSLLDGAHAAHWKLCGSLPIKLQNGTVDTASPKGPAFSQSILWYAGEKFGDFSLRLDFKRRERRNSGVFIRFEDPGNDPGKPARFGYEIDINGGDDTGAIVGFHRPEKLNETSAERLGEWNYMEISVVGSHIRVSMNGQRINVYDAGAAPMGYIGLQNFEGGEGVLFRNVRIKELTSPPQPEREPQTLAEALLGHVWKWHSTSGNTRYGEFEVYFMPDGNVKRAGAARDTWTWRQTGELEFLLSLNSNQTTTLRFTDATFRHLEGPGFDGSRRFVAERSTVLRLPSKMPPPFRR